MIETDALSRGRAAFERRAWDEAYAELNSADRASPLDLEDLERLCKAAYLAGNEAHSASLMERAYGELLDHGETRLAAACAFWLGFMLLNQGEAARAGGWHARAQRLLDDHHPGASAERGYLLTLAGERSIVAGDVAAAHAAFSEAAETGARFHEPDLTALSRLGQGQVSMMLGHPDAAVALFDEAMVAVTAGELSPIVAGIVYCAVISVSQETFDLRRAQEWTTALSNWCAAQPGLVPYRGQCLVHRAEILQLHGAWPDAIDEAQRASRSSPRSRLPGTPCMPWLSPDAFAESSIRPRRPTVRPASGAASRSPAWHCSAWRKVDPKPRPPLYGGCWTRRTAGRPGPGSWSRTSR